MLRRLVVFVVLALPVLTLEPAVAAEVLPPAIECVPQDAVIVLELAQPKAVLDLALDPKVTEVATSLPPYEQAVSQPGFKQFLSVIEFLEFKLKTDWKTGLRKLVGGGVTLAVLPGETVLLIVDSEDAEMLTSSASPRATHKTRASRTAWLRRSTEA